MSFDETMKFHMNHFAQEVKKSPLNAPSGPDKTAMIREDVLIQLLDEDLESQVILAQRLSSSPPRALPHTRGLNPVRKSHRAPAAQDAVALKRSQSETSSAATDESIRSVHTPHRVLTSAALCWTSVNRTAVRRKR